MTSVRAYADTAYRVSALQSVLSQVPVTLVIMHVTLRRAATVFLWRLQAGLYQRCKTYMWTWE